jgi:DNA-binding NarL/FixJ family response regulator
VRILIADRRADVRSAVKNFLTAGLDVETVAEASQSQELLAQMEAIAPDIVLVEWGLPGCPSQELLPRLRALDAEVQIIALGIEPQHLADALAAGANVFVAKSDPPKRLFTAVLIAREEREYGQRDHRHSV